MGSVFVEVPAFQNVSFVKLDLYCYVLFILPSDEILLNVEAKSLSKL